MAAAPVSQSVSGNIMNQNQLSRLGLINQFKNSSDPNITYNDNKISLTVGKTGYWVYSLWVLLILGLPIYIVTSFSSFGMILLALIWLLFMTFKFYNTINTSNDIIIDLKSSQISITPTDKLFISISNAKPRTINFSEINILLTKHQSMGGRFTPLGKRICIVLANNTKINMTDFGASMTGDKFANLLGDLIEKPVTKK